MNKEEKQLPTEEEPSVESPAVNGWLEQAYSRFEWLSLKYLDAFIIVCILALVGVIVVGILRARGIL